MPPLSARSSLRYWVFGCAVVALGAASPCLADWNAANDEANRQSMMNDMRANAAYNDQLNANALNNSAGYSYGSSNGSGRGTSARSTTDWAGPYKPYEYKPEGPHSVVATYYFTVYQQETEAETIARIRREAETGNAQSQFDLGRIYYTGYGVPLDLTQARKWFCEAAKQDHPIAKSQCAGMMYNGQGGPADTALAMTYLNDSAAKGDPYGEALYGYFTIDHANSHGGIDEPQPEAVAYLIKAADQGQVLAQATLGSAVLFYGTNGVSQDVTKAVGYLRQCAAQRLPVCMSLIGMMSVSGQNGVTQDIAGGVEMLRAAASKGRADAAGALAMIYAGDAQGMHDDHAAFAYATQAANGGDVQGQVILAKLYYFGQGTDRDLVQSARWFRAAAAQGNQEAIDALNEDDLAAAAKQL